MSFLMTMPASAWRQPPGIWNTTPATPNGVTTSGVEVGIPASKQLWVLTPRPTRMTDVGKDQHPWGPPCRCEVWKSFTSLGFGKAQGHGLEKQKNKMKKVWKSLCCERDAILRLHLEMVH